MRLIGAVVLVAVVVLGVPWLLLGNDFFLYRYFGPKRQEVRRQVFEQTRSFRQGAIQELQNMQREYIQANPTQQGMLKSLILRRALEVPDDVLPAELRGFIADLRRAS